jgi:hypothetical protein
VYVYFATWHLSSATLAQLGSTVDETGTLTCDTCSYFALFLILGPLEGIKILDFCQYINGPSATGQLCESGATVLKIEPKIGEGNRLAAGSPGVMHPGMEMYNRGKMSMTLDLKHQVF